MSSPVLRAAAVMESSPASAMRLLAPHLAAEPDDWYALCLAAQALIALDDCERSLEMSRRAAELNPSDDWPVRLQAIAHRNAGHTLAAPRIARRSVLVNPANWQTHYLVASTDLWADAATAQSMLAAEKARELAPDEPSTHNLVGQVALALGRSRLAIRSFEQALRLDPENSIAQHELARAHLRRFRIGKSVTGFLAAGRLDPSLPQTRINLHAIAIRAVQLLHYTIFVAFLIGQALPPVAAALVAVIGIGAAAWARYRGGPALMRFVAGLWRSDRLLMIWASLLTAAGAVLIVRPLLSLGHRQTGYPPPHAELQAVVLTLLVGGVITSWIRRVHYKPDYLSKRR